MSAVEISPLPTEPPLSEPLRQAVQAISYAPLRRLLLGEGRHLLARFERRTFLPGELMCPLDERPEGLFVVCAGEATLTARNQGFLPLVVLHRGHLFGYAALLEGRPSPAVVRAVTTTHTMVLPRAAFDEAVRGLPKLRAALAELAELQRLKRDFVQAMRQAIPFRATSPRFLADLLDSAELIPVEPDQSVVREGDRPSGFYYVASGELHALRTPAAPGETGGPTLVDVLYPGELFGDLAMVTGHPEPASVVAHEPSKVVRVSPASYEQLLEESQSFRRAVRVRMTATPLREHAPAGRSCSVALVHGWLEPGPLSTLADVLAETVAADHRDHVLLLTLPSPAPAPSSNDAPGDDETDVEIDHLPEVGGVARIRLAVPDGASGARRVRRLLERLRSRFDVVLIDAPARDEALLGPLAPLVHKVIYVAEDVLRPMPVPALEQRPVLHTALLGPTLGLPLAQGLPLTAVRLRLESSEIARLARSGDRRLERLPPRLRATLSRWGRAVTERRVGIALGGGGAWGFAHFALIRAMHEAGVPIDMVSGASFGSLAGAYYCVKGLEGLDLLIRHGRLATLATQLCYVSSLSLQLFVDAELGRARLEELEVPLFPVATDVASGTQYIPGTGTVGSGVRCSGAFPGIFTPVTRPGLRCVDGGFINNVPASVLLMHGANLIVASNIVAPPPPDTRGRPLLPGRIGRLLHEFNPLGRVGDVVRSGLVLMHSNGDREAEFADLTFETEFAGYDFADFTQGAAIAERAAPLARSFITDVRARWDRISYGDQG